MDAAHNQPLDFRVSLYSGGMLITGRVAPAHWWYEVSQAARRAQEEQATQQRGWGKRSAAPEGSSSLAEMHSLEAALRVARDQDRGEQDELTLIDVNVYPADFSSDTSTGGQSLRVARIPLGNITLWWLTSGETLAKRAQSQGAGVSWGFLFPIG
jgi:hypothetical protein